MPIGLLCWIGEDGGEYAYVPMSTPYVSYLLSLREILKADSTHGALVQAEFLDDQCKLIYHETMDSIESEPHWYMVVGKIRIKDRYPLGGGSTVVVGNDGVMWAVMPKHAAGPIETAVLAWETLEQMVALPEDKWPELFRPFVPFEETAKPEPKPVTLEQIEGKKISRVVQTHAGRTPDRKPRVAIHFADNTKIELILDNDP